MSLIRTLGLLASAFCVVGATLFIGYGLSAGGTTPFAGGAILLACGAGLIALQVRL